MTPESDGIQQRPFEVLFEEWYLLRKQGVATPAIAAWQCIPSGGSLWQNVLDVYNNASYTDLVYTYNGKQVFFVPENSDPALVTAVESNGGRNNVVVVTMWAQFAPSLFSQGEWAFFSPCTDGGQYTTNVVGAGITPCGQDITHGSPLGTPLLFHSDDHRVTFVSTSVLQSAIFRGFEMGKRHHEAAVRHGP